MTVKEITPVVLCGGSGTRLWPLSRKGFPKQFIPVYRGKSLLELTFERLSSFGGILALSGEEHRFFVEEAAEKSEVNLTQILEPVARDTAPAMALAACHARQENPESILLFCPADHFIPDNDLFREMVLEAADYAKDGNIVATGGRVLNVTARGNSLNEARDRACCFRLRKFSRRRSASRSSRSGLPPLSDLPFDIDADLAAIRGDRGHGQ